MKKALLIFIIVITTIIFGCGSGQKKVTDADLEEFIASQYVKNTGQFYMDTTFPFGYRQATTIELISYPDRVIWDTVHDPDGMGAIINGKLNFDASKIKERISLNTEQRKDLFNLLYNCTCKLPVSAACYDPRHLIVFYDKDVAFAYIEVCLECHQTKQSDRVYQNFTFCDEKISELRQLFKSFGIKYGLDAGDF